MWGEGDQVDGDEDNIACQTQLIQTQSTVVHSNISYWKIGPTTYMTTGSGDTKQLISSLNISINVGCSLCQVGLAGDTNNRDICYLLW